MKIQVLFYIITIVSLMACYSETQSSKETNENDVQIVGAMKNVMRKGELQGVFDLSRFVNEKHMYGLGPVEYLQGELLVFDGKVYQSSVAAGSNIVMQNNFQVKAPFFVYTKIEEWQEHDFPSTIKTLSDLESYLSEMNQSIQHPFAFRLSGTIESASIHIVNLPKGTKVSTHQDAHQGLVNYSLSKESVDILGFFSTHHQGIFTHHDSYVHMHLLTTDKTKMGHLDKATFESKNIKLFLPKK